VTSRPRPAQAVAAAPRGLLVVAPGADRDGLFAELAGRADYQVRVWRPAFVMALILSIAGLLLFVGIIYKVL